MIAAAWTVGGIAILAAGLWPLRSMVLRSLRRPDRQDRDEARSLLSQLSTAFDLVAGELPAETRAAVERYQLLAGAALGGTPDQDDCRRSIRFSRSGLKLLDGS
jgi:hypothetical protein